MNHVSVGKASGQLNRIPDDVRAAAAHLGLRPSIVLDGKPFFSSVDVERLADFFREQQFGGAVADRANRLS
jgi:hypothetical protein